MPLKAGTSKRTFSSNVSEMMHKYHARGGQVKAPGGPLHAVGKQKALEIALARAYKAKRASA